MPEVKTNQPQDQSQDNAVHIDFDFKFYASPAAQKLFAWLGQIMKWLLPFLLAFSTFRPSDIESAPVPPASQTTEIGQSSNRLLG